VNITINNVRLTWRGPIAQFLRDTTEEIDLEGALSSGKTTACLWKCFNLTQEYPGIWGFMCRYADGDTRSKLGPAWEEVCQLAGAAPRWYPDELFYEFPNRSRVYMFGLKSPDHLSRYAKLRGLGVAFIYNDQTEELPGDFSGELRARIRQAGYPHQLIYSPNPPNVTHWLAKEFPENQNIPGRRYYAVSLYDNAHNLPKETIERLERAYPPTHAKHRSVIMGRRGLNVTGEPVYAKAFRRGIHEVPTIYNPYANLLEAFDFGKHHPCYVVAQRPYTGGMTFLGGVMGQDMFLEDFLPIVKELRGLWFPKIQAVQTCCDPAGSHQSSQGLRYTAVQLLQEAGWAPTWKENANSPDTREAVIERLAGHMRRRTGSGEAFSVNNDPSHWLLVNDDGPQPMGFLADGFEAGYVWSEHFVSVGRKQIRQPKKDGWYEHGQNCAEYLELNFGAEQMTQEDEDKRALERRRLQQLTGQNRAPRSRTGWMR